ncbi:uncharacterized protein LOC129588296 [Paramacrobiotus metropolitanus]|uniref:uncharacterized protein LOC129588296 n=1 Tax=Paramacrobiotus metropolitanus TaxID=2943436 RepID=UPI002445BC0D|nr:uncharacterized protein LOC129588296 [Paramacrobiotus metropolitanus]
MDNLILPKFPLFDKPVPPLRGVRSGLYLPNKPYLLPAIKHAYRYPLAENIWHEQYCISATNANGNILHPLSTVLPLGAPSLLANLQDYCTEIVPFAVQTQQWVRDMQDRRPRGRPRKGKAKKNKGKAADEEDEEMDHGPGEDSVGTSKTSLNVQKTAEDFANELNDIPERDTFLLDTPLPSMPLYRWYKPYRTEMERVKDEGRRAAVKTGLPRVGHINSPVNWYFSGGALSYLSFTPERGFVISPKGTLTGVQCLPVTISDSRTGSRVVEAGAAQETVTEDVVYQIVSQQSPDFDYGLIGIRHATNCSILQQQNIDTAELTYKTVLQRPDDFTAFSHIASSPYVVGEFLTGTQNGYVTLWDVEMPTHIFEMNISEMAFRRAARHQWIGCYFGSGGREFGVMTNAAVELFDRRLTTGRAAMTVLMTRGLYTTGVENDIVAAQTLRGDHSFYHVVASTRELLVVDQRYPKLPVLRCPSPAPTPTMYLSHLAKATTVSDAVVTGAQMAQTCVCYELTVPEHLPVSIASLPFCTATPRQLVEHLPLSNVYCDFTTQERLRKPIIGMTPIGHLDADGFTVATVSACGDLFVQSFEVVSATDYNTNQFGTKAFSSVHFDWQLDDVDCERWVGWLRQARGRVSDPTTKSYLRVFQPGEEAKISERLGELREMCATAHKRKPHPECLRCVPRESVDHIEKPDEICPRCQMALGTVKRQVHTANLNRFVFVTEDYAPGRKPAELPDALKRKERFREMALTNRIAHRIAVHCYHETISDAGLLPKAENKMILPVLKKGRGRKSKAEEDELRKTLLERAENLEQAEIQRNISPPPLFPSEPREKCVGYERQSSIEYQPSRNR